MKHLCEVYLYVIFVEEKFSSVLWNKKNLLFKFIILNLFELRYKNLEAR